MVAAFSQMKFLSKFGYGGWEIAHGEVGFLQLTYCFQFVFVHLKYLLYLKGSPWEILDEIGRNVQMTVRMEFVNSIVLGDGFEATGFHQ